MHATANWAKFKAKRYFKSKEKIKDWRDLSAAQCFFDEFQARGVYPPIILSNYVRIKVKVFGILSQTRWNSAAEKLNSLALYNKVNLTGFCL